jgi:Bacterial mobilisation protein (MobC)
MARPKTPDEKALKHTFAIRLTDTDLASVQARAQLAGLEPRVFAREIVTKRSFKPKLPRATILELMALRADLGRIGTNLNQMAAAANRGAAIDAQTLQDAKETLYRIADITLEMLHGKPLD